MDTMLYRVNAYSLKLYLSITGLTIVLMVFPFLTDLSQCDYVCFPCTSLLTWIIEGHGAWIIGSIKTLLYLCFGMIMIHDAHGKTSVSMILLPPVLEWMLNGFTGRMINIDEILIIECGMIVMWGKEHFHKVVKP